MFTRRDALKLAAAAAITPTATAPFAVSPAEAAVLLDQPATFDGRYHPGGDADLSQPLAFARSLDGTDFGPFFDNGSAEAMTEYKQALIALEERYPELNHAEYGHPIGALDEAALGMWCMSWMAGVRAGVQYEHLRLAMLAPRETCRACHGHGRTWSGRPYRKANDGTNGVTCDRCGGAGTVPTPAPKLSALGVG